MIEAKHEIYALQQHTANACAQIFKFILLLCSLIPRMHSCISKWMCMMCINIIRMLTTFMFRTWKDVKALWQPVRTSQLIPQRFSFLFQNTITKTWNLQMNFINSYFSESAAIYGNRSEFVLILGRLADSCLVPANKSLPFTAKLHDAKDDSRTELTYLMRQLR